MNRSLSAIIPATNPGAGLIWGLGYAFLFWLAIPAGILPIFQGTMSSMGTLDATRAHFPELVAYIVCLAPLGLALGLIGAVRSQTPQPEFSISRAVIVGGLAGALGGFVFGRWAGEWYFALISDLLN